MIVSMNTRKEKQNKLLRLFIETFVLSAFTFGGGYVIVTLLKTKFVDKLHWIDENEMLDLVAIAQSSPGAIAVNGAVVVGYKLCGLPGVFAAVTGAIIPPLIIMTLISLIYGFFKDNIYVRSVLKGMRSGICAVIASVVYDMTKGIVNKKDYAGIAILIAAFILNYILKVNVMFIIPGAALIGVIRTIVFDKAKRA